MKFRYLLGVTGMVLTGAALFFAQNEPVAKYENRTNQSNSSDLEMGHLEYYRSVRANPETGELSREDMLKAREEVAMRSQMASRNFSDLNVEFVGPTNVGGRTRAVLVTKGNSNVLYTGGVNGGLWKSENAGGTWTMIPSVSENLTIASIAEAADGTIYVGTGSSFEGSADTPGGGIYKSTDGTNFSLLASTVPTSYQKGIEWAEINRIRIHPITGDVYAGTNRGLRVSTDGGATWANPLFIDPSCNVPGTGAIHDIEIMSDGRVLVVHGGRLYNSADGSNCSYTAIDQTTGGLPNASRMDVDFCDSQESKVYAANVNSSGQLAGVYESDDYGMTFSPLSPAPPSPIVDSTFSLFGDNGQGIYDLALECYPNNPDAFLIGGVQMYRVDGSWTRVAEYFGSVIVEAPWFVHPDIHEFTFDPNNPDIVYIASDGGIGKCMNASDNNMTFTTNNRNYTTSQFYGIATSADGMLFGGTQDNSTMWINTNMPGSSTDATQVIGGDGFDCEISDIAQALFGASQYGRLQKVTQETGNSFPLLGPPYAGEGRAPFHSVNRLWESASDVTSRDSIEFFAGEARVSIGTGNDSRKNYSGTLEPAQPSANLVVGSVTIDAGSVIGADAGNGTLVDVSTGDTLGNIDYATGDYSVTFQNAPAIGLNVFMGYDATYNQGDTLFLVSGTHEYPFSHVLSTDLNVGDTILIQDPVQSLLVHSYYGGILITRDGLQDELPRWLEMPTPLGNFEWATCYEFSKDGKHLYAGTSGGNVIRFDGLENVYHDTLSNSDMPNVVSYTVLGNFGGVTGIALNDTDEERLLVTRGGYGNIAHVYEITNALSATGTASRRDVTGDLPGMPVYDAEYDVRDDKFAVIGTDLGAWFTNDVTATPVAWTQVSGIPQTPVWDIRQQKKPWNEATNHGVIYFGTHGLGIWKTSDLVNGVEEDFTSFVDAKSTDLHVYPNPTRGLATIEFNLNKPSAGSINVYDLNGKLVYTLGNKALQAGMNRIELNTNEFPGGIYFVQITAGEVSGMSRLAVVK